MPAEPDATSSGPASGPASAPASDAGRVAGGAQVAVAITVMNLAMYGFTMSAARLLGPTAYGGFFAVVNLMLIVGVLQLGLQATAARRISAEPAHAEEVAREVLRVSLRAGVLLSGVLLLAAPAVTRLLDLQSLATALLAAVAAVPLTVSGAQAGILQGERRWRELAVLYLLMGVPRLAVGLALVLWRPTELMAFLGVGVGFVAPCLYGLHALRRVRPRGARRDRRSRSLVAETARSSQALLAFFALTNADMLVARVVLDPGDSGRYAAGLLVTRAVLFLPQFVVVVAFPSMSAEGGGGRALVRSVLAVTGLGVLCTAATAALPGLALVFAGGAAYAGIRDVLWLFALLGTATGVVQVLVYSALARPGARSVHLVWAALVAMVLLATTVGSVAGMLAVVLLVDTTLLACLGVAASVGAWRGRGHATPVAPDRRSGLG
ncbi:lipopolysaccharide biosynthesis protein [Nocardioides sp. SYSU D00065]|uniref:lipopolysaccharide biosynthesis protein n=1 Tax=Nocardioides sp. SYSU D00065 TaxID=2817378 RepID=UPI001B338543|nr:oligosaccharide flippase family protein [Nocardioides sp. SYSU D00065]